ncbi:MAG: M48 family metallopeptidase [Burkholderiales bacterium]|nr:M48 family metallopeptidase [Burkholderiales bacterium]
MWSLVFLVIVVWSLLLKLYLNYRQVNAITRHINQVPDTFRDSVSLAEHTKAGQYNLAKLRISRFEEVFSSIILLIFTLGGGIQLINDHLNYLSDYPLTTGVAVILIFNLLNSVLSLPFSIYSTFGIEQRFGFNNTTVKLFITDMLKSLLLAGAIGIPLIYVVLWLMNMMGNTWWIWVWLLLVGFNLAIMVIYPVFIAPLFNKFTPLKDPVLQDKINRLLERCGFKSRGVFVMDGSKRSSHGNAYFTGLGRAKRIVFFDTLIKQLTHDETEAVLAHELGHFKKKHIVKQMIMSFGLTLVILYILSLLIKYPTFYNSLGVTTVTTYNGLILFMLLLGVVSLPFAPLFSYFSRKNEFEADSFAAAQADKKHLISGLVKLYKDNASTLTPDSLYVKFYYSHPPASVRIAHLEQV